MNLNETYQQGFKILESDRQRLPEGVLCRVRYPICNIGKLNANNRLYEKAVWEKVMADGGIVQKMQNRTLFGQAEHPSETQSDLQLTSHVIFETTLDEDRVFQTMDVLDTPTGRIVDTLLRAGCSCGVSTRAEGDLEECEIEESGEKKKCQRVVPESYRYVTTDFTADPSTFGAAPESIQRNVIPSLRQQMESGQMKPSEKRFATLIYESIQKTNENGLADKAGKKPEDFDKASLEAGTKIELEHTTDESKARKIAMDHLTEDPKYYTKLKNMESGKCNCESKVAVAVKEGKIKENSTIKYNGSSWKVTKVSEANISMQVNADNGQAISATVDGNTQVNISPEGVIEITPGTGPTPDIPMSPLGGPEGMPPEGMTLEGPGIEEPPMDAGLPLKGEEDLEHEMSETPEEEEIAQETGEEEEVPTRKFEKKLMKELGQDVDEKSTCPSKSKKMAKAVAKSEEESGKSKEKAEEIGYATANKAKKKENESIAQQMIDLQIKEATVRAERDKILEELDTIGDSGLQIQMLKAHIAKVQESALAEINGLRKLLEQKSKIAGESVQKMNESIKTSDSKENQVKQLKEAVQQAKKVSLTEGRKQVLREYFDMRLAASRLRVDDNTRALLENCSSLEDVNSLIERVIGLARRVALQPKPISKIQVHESVPVNREQRKAEESVTELLNLLG